MRVAVTGIGLISPLGIGIEAYWEAAAAGRTGVCAVEGRGLDDLPARFGGVVPDAFDPERWIDRKTVKNTDKFVHFAVGAAGLALDDAGLDLEGEPDGGLRKERIAVIVGSGIGGIREIYEQTERMVQRGPGRMSPFFVPKMMINAAAGHIAIRWGLRGPNFATVSACATSMHALGMGLWALRAGAADVVLAGGTEAALNRLGMASFTSSRALSTRNDEPERASRPFDKDRDGFVMGEGAGVFVLEPLERARARGARIYAELAGFAASDDGHHMTAPEPEGIGARAAMQLALEDAGTAPEEVGLVSAHATSTPLGDIAETLAIKRAFGDHAARLMVNATKSQTGHLLGAAGMISAASAVLAVHRGVITPTINLENQDPACDLDCVPGQAREVPVRAALANAFGFGGHNATLVFKRAD